jgi:hypothetical protein
MTITTKDSNAISKIRLSLLYRLVACGSPPSLIVSFILNAAQFIAERLEKSLEA